MQLLAHQPSVDWLWKAGETNIWSKDLGNERSYSPPLVTPGAGESILKPCFRRDALSLA